jgi:two-component system chemotaxis response regulator CheY
MTTTDQLGTQVLVVDDDVVSRMVLMHLVDTCGSFDIVEAEDGAEAWEQLQGGLRPAIVFCDLRMPRLSGMDLLRRVRAEPALGGVPFVLVTSANDSATMEQATDFGASGFLVKPFLPEQVRVYLMPFLETPLAEAEPPLETMQRLGINSERLLVYLGGFQSQLTGASGEIDVLLARGEHAAALGRLERLSTGGQTLGLNSAAAALDACAGGPLTVDAVQGALADALRAVVRQSETVKRLTLT